MKKQSLIKYYCALFLVLVLLAGFNNAATGEPTLKPSISPSAEITNPSPVTTQSSANQDIKSDDNILLPLILSILALAVSVGAIVLTIFKNREIGISISSLDNKLKSLEKKYTDLSNQITSLSTQHLETISRNSAASVNSNIYLTPVIDKLSERIYDLENRLQLPRNNEQSIKFSYQSRNIETDINPFNQTAHLSQSDSVQPPENLAYIELVNTYNTNPRLLEQRAIKVSEPTDSINRRHTDSSQKIVLEKANNSNYWVVHDDAGTNCWLLPKNKLKIDQYRYETTKALFECHGYHPEYSTFKLAKPAKVIPLSSDEQTWQLEEPGIIEFSVEA